MTQPEEVMRYVGRKIQFLFNSPDRRGDLAILRHGIGKDIAEAYGSWQYVLDGMPEDMLSKDNNGEPTYAENAAYVALTLYALHQQGKTDNVNDPNISFGEAVGRLAGSQESVNGVKRRFDAVITSNDLQELVYHARGLIQLMKSSNNQIGFDYAKFAEDLFRYQFPESKRNVIFGWGQSYYRNNSKDKDKQE